MSHEEIVDAASFLYWIGQNAPPQWEYNNNLLLNIDKDDRDTNNYRTTLAHKANTITSLTAMWFGTSLIILWLVRFLVL